MTKYFASILLAVPFFLTMTACTPSSSGPSSADTERPQYLGDLEQKLNELYAPENARDFDPCDTQNRTKILEIARVLEQKRSEIDAFGKNQPAGPDSVYLDVGPFKFRDDRGVRVGENTWESYEYGWPDIIADYDVIKDWPVDKYWFSLNQSVRAVVMDDDARIYYYQFMSVNRANGPKIQEIDTVLQACLADESCLNPALTVEQKAFLSTNKLFEEYFYRLGLSSVSFSNEKKREKITIMAKRIHNETDKFGFYKNPLLHVEGDKVVVPMDFSVFGDQAVFMAEQIEKFWNSIEGVGVKIELIHPPVVGYIANVDQIIGGRAFVDHEERRMQLHNYGRIRSSFHEFGHILGLKDYYYTSWNAKTCNYVVESNPGDIMSGSQSGVVLPEHWQMIKANYWPKATAQP